MLSKANQDFQFTLNVCDNTTSFIIIRYIYIGQIRRAELKDLSNNYVYNVKCIKIHEDYMVSGYGFDVALVKLAIRPAIFEPWKVWPACLPCQGDRVDMGKECFITGRFHFGLVYVVLVLSLQ